MPTSANDLFAALEEPDRGVMVPETFREFIHATGFLVDNWLSDDPKHQQWALALTHRLFDAARDVGWLTEAARGVQEEIVGELSDSDERWALWHDLLAKVADIRGRRPRQEWRPLRFARIFDLSLTPLANHLVQVTFDSRLSRRVLIAELTKRWPDLTRRGWVRRTRRTKDNRSLAMIRLVCLQLPADLTWEQRRLAWNESDWVRAKPAWREDSYREFESSFSRAEKALTGNKDGLASLYRQPRRVLGDRTLLLRSAREAQDYRRMVVLAKEIRRVQDLLASGLSVENAAAQLRAAGGQWGELDADEALEAVRRMAQEDSSVLADPDLSEIEIVDESERWLKPGREEDPIGVSHGVNLEGAPEVIAAIQALHHAGASAREIAVWKNYPVERVRAILALPAREESEWIREYIEAELQHYQQDHVDHEEDES